MKLRVLPLVITGAALLLVLKAAGLATSGHYAFEPEAQSSPKIAVAPTYRPLAVSRAPGTSYYAAEADTVYDPLVTGSVPTKKEAEPKPEAEPAQAAESGQGPDQAATPAEPSRPDMSPSERALLDRLQNRRHELDGRSQELDMRESLLRAAEQKIQDELAILKSTEERIAAAGTAKKTEEDARLKDLVTMYENMKPKQAAAIFDGLDLKVLVDLATQMNPKKSGDIIARMSPDAAQRLTTALARRQMNGGAPQSASSADALPKIQGTAPIQ